ncbi:MAG: hypothetical protein ACTS6P_01745 [Candidatus Hodgkinia cicadicola]
MLNNRFAITYELGKLLEAMEVSYVRMLISLSNLRMELSEG